MTGACRPTPDLDAIIAKAILKAMQEDYRIGGSKKSLDAQYLAEAISDALLAEGEVLQRDGQALYRSTTVASQRVLVVPLDAGEDTT